MASEEILKSYLVSIGYKIDAAGYKKFSDQQEDAAKKTKEASKQFDKLKESAGLAFTAMGAGIASVAVISTNLEKLYFESKRAGSSATNLKAIGAAAEQIGVSSDDAVKSVETLAVKLRQPGMAAQLQGQFGINANQDKSQVLLDLVDKLANKPEWQRDMWANFYGIDPQTMKLMVEGRQELHRFYEEKQRVFKDLDAQAKMAHEANQPLRDMKDRFAELVNTVGSSFIPLLKEAAPIISHWIDYLIQADKATEGWSSRVIGLTASLVGTIGAMKALGIVAKLFGAGGASEAASVGAGIGSGFMGVVGVGLPGVMGGLLAKWSLETIAETQNIKSKEKFDSVSQSNRYFLFRKEHPELNLPAAAPPHMETDLATDPGKWAAKGGPVNLGTPSISTAVPLNNPGNLRSFGNTPTVERARKGVSIGRFAKFDTPEAGLSAMAAVLLGKGYAGGGRDTIQSILGRYAPGSENDTGAYIKDVSKRTGFAADAHLDLQNPQVLASLMAAMIHHEQGKDPFSMAMISNAANSRLTTQGHVVVKMDQKTDIHITGGDAKATGAEVARVQKDVNQNLVRNLSGAIL